MNRVLLLSLFFTAFSFQSCQTNDPENLHNEIMAIHDEVMPKTGEISYLYLAFRKKGDMDTTLSLETKNELISQANDLEAAEEEMMVWMNDYISPFKMDPTKSKESIISYLKNQKVLITNIKVHTDESLRKAEKLKKELSIND